MTNEPIQNQIDPASIVHKNGEGLNGSEVAPPPKKRTMEEIHAATEKDLASLGVRWLLGSSTPRAVRSPEDSLHAWTVFAGDHAGDDAIRVETGDSLIVVGNDEVQVHRGPNSRVHSRLCAVLARGYAPRERSVSLLGPRGTTQLFPVEHSGAPKVFVVDIRKGETAGSSGSPAMFLCLSGSGEFVVGPDHDPLAEVPMRPNQALVSHFDNQVCLRAFEPTRLIAVHFPGASGVSPRG